MHNVYIAVILVNCF